MLPISTSSDINHVKNMPYINLLEKKLWLAIAGQLSLQRKRFKKYYFYYFSFLNLYAVVMYLTITYFSVNTVFCFVHLVSSVPTFKNYTATFSSMSYFC